MTESLLRQILLRLVRMETRLARLMLHAGLTADGDVRQPTNSPKGGHHG